jgi:hypothetical protein
MLSSDLSQYETKSVADALKQWCRELPEPVIPFDVYHKLVDNYGTRQRVMALCDFVFLDLIMLIFCCVLDMGNEFFLEHFQKIIEVIPTVRKVS